MIRTGESRDVLLNLSFDYCNKVKRVVNEKPAKKVKLVVFKWFTCKKTNVIRLVFGKLILERM